MLFYVFSMAIATLAYAFFMVTEVQFNCGPFSIYSNAMEPMRKKFKNYGFPFFLYNMTAFTPILWCLVGFLTAAMVFKSNHLSIMRYYFRNKINDQ